VPRQYRPRATTRSQVHRAAGRFDPRPRDRRSMPGVRHRDGAHTLASVSPLSEPATQPSLGELAAMLDQSLLQPSLTQGELETGCREACRLQVASVCVVPHFLQRAVELISGTETLPGTTLAFPHGAQSLAAKLAELDVAIGAGAKEVDAVVNISQVVSNEFVS